MLVDTIRPSIERGKPNRPRGGCSVGHEWIRAGSKLLHEPGNVSVGPVFDEPTIFDAVYRDPTDLDGLASWLVPDALAQERSARCDARHHLVAVGDDVINDMQCVGKCRLQDAHVLP